MNTLLGDLGLLFGSYRRVYNAAILVACWNILGGYLITWYIFKRGVPDPWTFIFTRCLQTQELFDDDQSGVQLTRRMKIKFWKITFIAYLTAVYNACVGSAALLVFVVYSYYQTFPITSVSHVIHLCATIWWTVCNTFTFSLGWSLTTVSFTGTVLGVIFWICQMRYVIKRFRQRLVNALKASSVEDRDWLLQRSVKVSFARWRQVNAEIFKQRYHWAICVGGGAIVFNMLACGLIWLYAACYLGNGQPILKLMNYLVTGLTIFGLWGLLCVMSLMERTSGALPSLLYKYAYDLHHLKIPMSRQSLASHKLINSWLTSDACSVTPNVVQVGGLHMRLEPLFDVTFDSTFWLAFETASYYLLTVDTIGIPQDD